jgi:6,7-dimethyl-8-ribityllumazine synthase
MGTTNLSAYNPELVPDASDMRFGIVVSDWNMEVTWALLEGAVKTLKKHGAVTKNIVIKHVPGSFELTLGA